jgi:YD repeat-containing protein
VAWIVVGLLVGVVRLRAELRLEASHSGTNVLLTWTNAAALESAATVTGAWTTVTGAVSPHQVAPTNPASFYRLRQSGGGPFAFRYLAPAFTTGLGDPSGGCGCTSPENPNSLAAGGNAQDNGLGSLFLHTGELTQHAVDLAIPGRGFDWKFERRYRSGMSYDGPLGHGWDFNYNQRLAAQPNGDVLRMDGLGRADRYGWTGSSFQSPSGFYTRLVRNLDGTFDERDRHGTIESYSATNSLGIAKLTRIRDRNGNQMTFACDPDGQLTNVVDTLGRSIAYGYDGNGRLAQVMDFTGRTLQFGYDADGNLVSVTSPVVTGTPNRNDFPLGKTTRYTYSSGYGDARLNHNLLSVTAPNEVAAGGPPRLVAQYDTNLASSNADRVISIFLGGTNASGVGAGGTITYTYTGLGPAPTNDFNTAVSATTVTNRNGNVAEYRFNQLGNLVRQVQFTRGLRPGDPPGYTNQFEFNPDGEMTRRINPEGGSVENTYDTANPDRFQRGNLLQVRRLPGPRGGDQTNRVTTYTYEPLFNQVRTITEPRGNDPSYVPPNGGANTPGRYTTTNTFDYQEAASAPAEAATWSITIPPGLLGLGDVNGDGQTNQAFGNVVRQEAPTVNLLAGSNQALVEGDTAQSIVTRFIYNQFGQLTQTEDARGNIATYTYFPENDPDGDGLDLIAGRDPTTGWYLSQTVRDAFIGARRLDPPPAVAITNRFQRDRVGDLTRHTDGRGFATTNTYNALDQVVQEEQPKVDPSQSTGYLRRYSYDANNNRVGLDIQNVTTDPTNHLPALVASHPFFQHRYAYDLLDRLVEDTRDATRDPSIGPSSQPELLTTRYRYDADQNLIRSFSPLAVSGAEPENYQSFTYDERDLRYTVTRGGASPQASTWTYAYDGNGNLTRWTDAEDNDATPGPESEVTTYDGFDRRRTVVDRAGDVQRFTYDPAGRTVREEFLGPATAGSSTNVLLRSVSSRYDELGRLFQVDRPLFVPAGASLHTNVDLTDGPLTPGDMTVSQRYEYDANSRLTFQVKDNGAVFQQVYDGAGRLLWKVLPQVDTVTPGGPYPTWSDFTYDADGNLVRQSDILSNPHGKVPPQVVTRLMVYDRLNRRVRETDHDGHTRYTEFDSRNNQVGAYDARGPLMPDPLGLYTSGDINDRGNATRHAYDGLGRPWQQTIELTVTGEGGAPLNTTNTYNPDGLITLRTTYDANGRMVSRADDKTNTQFYAYDVLNRQVAITNADGGWRAWTFDRDDNPIGLRDENNTLHTFTYDGLNRLRAHALSPDATKTNVAGLPLLVGTTLQTFEYDGLSRLVRSFDNNDPATTNDDWTVTQAYDSLGRVLEDNQNGRAVNGGYTAEDRTTLYYPNGRVVHQTFDGLNHLVHLANYNELAVDIEPQGSCPRPLQCAFSIPVVGLLATDSRSFNNEGLVTGIQQTCGSNTVDSFTYVRN